jgi:hypothetical protein
MAPEIAPRIWGLAQDEIMKRFDKTNAIDLPDWALTALKIWANKELVNDSYASHFEPN